MSIRRSLFGLVAGAAFAFAGCAGTPASGAPSVAVPTVPASIDTADLEGFCADVAGAISSDWPNIEPATAGELRTIVTEWAASPALASIQGDIQTLGTWLATAATASTTASPPPEVDTAFQNVLAFADTNC